MGEGAARDVIVIGGGLVGWSTAYRLARAGLGVTVVDRADPGYATAAGAGIIAPGTSFRPLPAFYPFGSAAVAYYTTLLAELAEDGENVLGQVVWPGTLATNGAGVSIRLETIVRRARMWVELGEDGVGERPPDFAATLLGTYDPSQKGSNAVIDLDKVNAWIAKGAQPTDTVRSLIKKAAAAK